MQELGQSGSSSVGGYASSGSVIHPLMGQQCLWDPVQESYDIVMDHATQRIPIQPNATTATDQINVYCRNAPILEIADS